MPVPSVILLKASAVIINSNHMLQYVYYIHNMKNPHSNNPSRPLRNHKNCGSLWSAFKTWYTSFVLKIKVNKKSFFFWVYLFDALFDVSSLTLCRQSGQAVPALPSHNCCLKHWWWSTLSPITHSLRSCSRTASTSLRWRLISACERIPESPRRQRPASLSLTNCQVVDWRHGVAPTAFDTLFCLVPQYTWCKHTANAAPRHLGGSDTLLPPFPFAFVAIGENSRGTGVIFWRQWQCDVIELRGTIKHVFSTWYVVITVYFVAIAL